MQETPTRNREIERPSVIRQVGQALRRYFVTGLATLFPLAVTCYLLVLIFRFTDGLLGRFLHVRAPGLGLIVTFVIILAVGVLSIHFFGRVVFATCEAWFGRLPLVKKIYPAVKQLTQFIFSESGRQAAFRRVVLVQYPRPGVYSLAFVTNEGRTEATGSPTTLLTLLIPNPPSPFTGPIIFVPKDDVIPLNLSVEEAIKLVVSGGIVASPLEAAKPPV